MSSFFKAALVLLLFSFFHITLLGWGFYAHKQINHLAVFTLPVEMVYFYKANIAYISENAVNPDKRRYTLKQEAARHFIDLDRYPDSIRSHMPKFWREAVTKFTEDTLQKYGIVPWHIYMMKFRLTEAFKKRDKKDILRLSAEIGHYIADSNVPLHTTQNYNGQLTNQQGIHGFWESRLPELFSDEYNFFTGKAAYLTDVQAEIWKGVYTAHAALDSVLQFEKKLNLHFSPDQKYSMEERNGTTLKVYSEAYAKAYHKLLNNQVERQMIASVKLVGSIWYTCWVDAGQPELEKLSEILLPEVKDTTGTSAYQNHENCTH